ncbi:hypothetical protein J1N35_043184 [Gossypium stocksii]|uniref:Uncharacterized protein n=1 Tax=Gossypium stocksii TaxID=47602 RepID=A0A9D3ZEU1_9ROSI|nr:hypothetical protein J1N35_043184 [Gossypium stocksii]
MGYRYGNRQRCEEGESGEAGEGVDGRKEREKMRENVIKWKRKAERAACLDGPSMLNLDRLINEVLLKGHE